MSDLETLKNTLRAEMPVYGAEQILDHCARIILELRRKVPAGADPEGRKRIEENERLRQLVEAEVSWSKRTKTGAVVTLARLVAALDR